MTGINPIAPKFSGSLILAGKLSDRGTMDLMEEVSHQVQIDSYEIKGISGKVGNTYTHIQCKPELDQSLIGWAKRDGRLYEFEKDHPAESSPDAEKPPSIEQRIGEFNSRIVKTFLGFIQPAAS